MNLRIAVNAFSNPVGGGRTVLRRILPRMADFAPRSSFTVFGPSGDEALRGDVARPNVVWQDVPAGLRGTGSKLLWENLSFPRELVRGGFDVVLCPANVSHFRGTTPKVVMIQNSLPFYRDLYRFESARTRARLHLLAWASHHFIARAEGAVFLTRTAREDALRGTSVEPKRDTVAYLGVDEDFGREPHEAARADAARRYDLPGRYVLSASHLYRYKRFEALIEAWGLIPPATRDGRTLVIAGEPHDRAYADALAERVSRLADPSSVRFIGGVTTATLSTLHAGADAVAFLSACEAGSITVLEALASGRPLLLSNRSALPELGSDAALYADPDRPEEVARQLARLLSDPALARDLGARARRRAAEFTWDRTARTVLAVLESVASARR
ncbi:MAG TPA: glycosyltransferase family 1 protein [Candidatus Polarisedimenticolaceae bacterium]|nr:glycosyltransferase family 1 protein [Candidatus Polarisedimenticolaceae bacterium]